jgi:hypothetical protein
VSINDHKKDISYLYKGINGSLTFKNFEELLRHYQSLSELIDKLSQKPTPRNRFSEIEVVSERE